MNLKPKIILFQCQYCLAASDDQVWVETLLPENVKLIKHPAPGASARCSSSMLFKAARTAFW